MTLMAEVDRLTTFAKKLQLQRDSAVGVAADLTANLAAERARVERVRALHAEREFYVVGGTQVLCDGCDRPWPCSTIRALDGTEQQGGDQ